MPAFKEISLQQTIPVIYSRGDDGTILTAIRVPRDDVRLEKWGWVLNLSYRDGNGSQDKNFMLQGGNEQQYSRIFTTDEVGSYSERYGYFDWEVGYYNQLNKIQSRRNTLPLNIDILEKEMLQASVQNILESQEELTRMVHDQLLLQNQRFTEEVYRQLALYVGKVTETEGQLASYSLEVKNKLTIISEDMAKFIEKNTETYENIDRNNEEKNDLLIEGIDRVAEQMPSAIYSRMKSDFDLSLNTIDLQLDSMDKELKIQLGQVQTKAVKAIEDSFIPLADKFQDRLVKLDEFIKEQTILNHNNLLEEFKEYSERSEERLEGIMEAIEEQVVQQNTSITREFREHYQRIESTNQQKFNDANAILENNAVKQEEQIRDLNEQIKKLLQIYDSELDDFDGAEEKDIVTVATKIAKKPSNRIRRIANSQIETSNKYYENVNEQSERGFQLAYRLSWVGCAIFGLVVSITIIWDVFHFQRDPWILGGGLIISSIAELLSGLNFFYSNRVTEPLTLFHRFLDRITRASIAHAMVEELEEQDKREAIDMIIGNLLRDDVYKEFQRENVGKE